MLIIIAIILCSSSYVISTENESKNIFTHELPCLTYGGICVKSDECPADNISKIKGLCPIQQKNGVECCHGIPKSETRCRQRGGACFPKSYTCPESHTFSKATDCSHDEKCCILVH